jgi:hypothetical protein
VSVDTGITTVLAAGADLSKVTGIAFPSRVSVTAPSLTSSLNDRTNVLGDSVICAPLAGEEFTSFACPKLGAASSTPTRVKTADRVLSTRFFLNQVNRNPTFRIHFHVHLTADWLQTPGLDGSAATQNYQDLALAVDNLSECEIARGFFKTARDFEPQYYL